MKHAAFALTLIIPALLTACQNDAEETPDIEEAIPLDGTSGTADTPADTGAEPATQSAQPTPEPGIDTMESGANPPGMTEPPAGSKLQPAD